MKKIICLIMIMMSFVLSGCGNSQKYDEIALTKTNYFNYVNVLMHYEKNDKGLYEIYACVQPKRNEYKFEGAYVYIEVIPRHSSKVLMLDNDGYSGEPQLVSIQQESHTNSILNHNDPTANKIFMSDIAAVSGTVFVPR